MAQDFHLANRYFSSVKTSYRFIKSYVSSSSTVESAPNAPRSSRIRPRRPPQGPSPTESVHLFPGWATRRYVDNDRCQFDLHVHVSGYATTQHPLQSRTQRTFMRLAKGFAGMNKLAEAQCVKSVPVPGSANTRTLSTDDVKENDCIDKLDESYNEARERLDVDPTNDVLYDDEQPSHEPVCLDTSDILQRWQCNLESRMQLFWPTMLSCRVVRLELFVSQHHGEGSDSSDMDRIGQFEVQTCADGAFQHHFVVSWDDIGHQPGFAEPMKEHKLVVYAKLLPSPIVAPTRCVPESKVAITLTHAPIRVISDIDDTVKMSNILGGARAIFRNVFVHDLEDTRIPGMGKWYTTMWERGVRFHYVSNGPIQLLPVILKFLHISQLPHGSIKLKSYGARSIFNNLLTAPADRKRDGLIDILNAFQDSKFILVGDTGEQDLELYTQLASTYPNRILAIFVRDVEAQASPIPDPTGKDWRRHVRIRSNTSSSNSNGVSRSNSILANAIRLTGRSWTSSLTNSPSPPLSTTPLPPSSIAEDDVPAAPISSEPEPILPMDDPLSTAKPISNSKKSPDEKTPWLSSSPSPISCSPLSSSSLLQNEGPMSIRQSSLILARGNSVEIQTTSSTVLAEAEAEGANGRTTTIAFADEMPISQSPERANVLKSSWSAHSSPRLLSTNRSASSGGHGHGHGYKHKPGTVDDGIPSSAPPRFLRPRPPIRNATNPSVSGLGLGSGSGTGTGTGAGTPPSTSPSMLSLSLSRTQTESERKRSELQERVWRARSEVPEGIVLRIFREPSECVETEGVLKGHEEIKMQ
ncbi:hypothetical protein APHAL10511_002361 [Amanita phalloides]|nr:hypothetical protein APHAL10511_002361 [Amanita phalloides]